MNKQDSAYLKPIDFNSYGFWNVKIGLAVAKIFLKQNPGLMNPFAATGLLKENGQVSIHPESKEIHMAFESWKSA